MGDDETLKYPGVLLPADGTAFPKELQRLPPPTLPTTLFRHRGSTLDYLRNEIIEAKDNRRCFANQAKNFKDPYELRPEVDLVPLREYWILFKSLWELDPDFFPLTGSLSRVAALKGVAPDQFREKMFFNRRSFCAGVRDMLVVRYQDFLDTARIACFVRTYSDVRMWDNYSEGGAGVLFEYHRELGELDRILGEDGPTLEVDPGPNQFLYPEKVRVRLRNKAMKKTSLRDALRFSYRGHCAFGRVQYLRESVSVSELDLLCSLSIGENPYLSHALSARVSRDFIQKLVFTKPFSYRDEREWRLWYKKDELYAPLWPYSLKSITFGYKAHEKLVGELLTLCKEYKIHCYRVTRINKKSMFGRIALA